MSTRATIIVIDSENRRHQFYHHTDGYPEWMGELLKSYVFASGSFVGYGESASKRDKEFFSFLEKEGHFEKEELGICHADIEYMWFVKLSTDGSYDTVSYEKIPWIPYDSDEESPIKTFLKNDKGSIEYFKF